MQAGEQSSARAPLTQKSVKKVRQSTSKRNSKKRESDTPLQKKGPPCTERQPKRKKVAHEEISLSVSDGEDSEDADDGSSLGSFIEDDAEGDTTGAEQRACDFELGDEETPAKKGVKRPMQEAEEDEEKKKKRRSEQRELHVTYERGKGDTKRSVLEYHDKAPFFLPCSDFVTPWDKQPGRNIMDVGYERGKLAEGAFGIEAHARWFNSHEQQAKFAEAFSVPYDDGFRLKKVASDVPRKFFDPQALLSNATSKVLHCLRVTHAPTELDEMDGRHYDEVFVGLQRTSRALRQEMDGGPNGGLQSCAVDVLWHIHHGEETSNISDDVLRLLEILTMAKQGSKGDELYHIVNTDRVEWFTKGKVGLTKVQCGVRMKRPYNFHEATKKGARCAVQDIDPRLLRKLWCYRNGEEDFDTVSKEFIALSSLVHDRHQTNNPEMTAMEIKEEEQIATDPNPLKIFLYKDVLPAWDENTKQSTTVSIEAIYLIATCPANDPLVFLKSIAENNPAACTLLSSTFAHMNGVLGQPPCSWDQLFNTDRAGAAEVTPESRMLEGLFRFCDAQKLRNVNIGGFRMDVRDKKEMKVWRDYIEPLKAARSAHYRMIVKETLHDRSNWREALLPVSESAKWMDFYHGQTYWRVSNQQVDQEIADYVAMWEDEEERRDVFDRLKDWQRSHIQSLDGVSMFVPEGEGWARNSGLWIKIKTDNSRTHEDEIRETFKVKKGDDKSMTRWNQPQQECRLMKIWLANAKERACGPDPLDFMVKMDKWIPDIEWMKNVLPNMDEQNDNAEWLKEMVGDYVLGRSRKRFSNVNLRVQEIMQLVGKERNSMHKSVASIADVCRLELLFRTKMQKINTSVKNALVQMLSCELVQWRIAAMDIHDLKKQNCHKEKWTDDYKNMHTLTKNVQECEEWMDLLNLSTKPSIFFNASMSRLNSDLSYMNQLFMWNFICCTMAHNENRRGAYGMTMRVMDMAGTVDVLKEVENKAVKTTAVVKVTEKSPGAGADTTISFVMQMLVSSLTHISLTKEVKDLAVTARDTIHKNVSKMSYALLQGSGVLVNAKGEIMSSNTVFQNDLSNNAHFTELFKNDEDPAMLAWLESLMAHSGDVQVGAESGVNQAAWTTTQNLENYNVQRFKPMPVIVLTGNRPAQGTPASAVEGARWMCIASSTQDKDNGFLVVLRSVLAEQVGSMSCLPRPALQAITASAENKREQVQRAKSKRANLANKQSAGDIRRDIKLITRDDVQNNMMHFLLMQWLRKDAALLLSALTHEARSYWYSMKCTYSRLECAVGQLTRGLKRDFLDKNVQFWHRNAMGPWNKVSQISMHVFLTMSTALLDTVALTYDGWPLDLHLGFVLGVRALMTNFISFMAMAASLQLWLCSAVLDYNFMILSCYVYHFCAFQHSCSLRVLSLVLLGHELSDDDMQTYLCFCEHLAPCVLEGAQLRQHRSKSPRNVLSGTLQLPGHSTLSDWFSFGTHTEKSVQTLVATMLARTGGEQERKSVYCQPRMGFVHSSGIKGFGKSKDYNTQTAADPNICGTPRRVLGTAMGYAQRPYEHQKRVERGACIDGRTTEAKNGVEKKKKMEAWENTVEFWKNVRKGTLLPECSTSTNDIFKVRFDFTPHTGIWWDNTMQNAGLCDGIVKHFLLQSDLDLSISHHDFFTALLQPYLARKGIDDRVYGGPKAPGVHKDAWSLPVLCDLNVFEYTSNPHQDAQKQIEGVYINICMRLVHYVLIQGLGMTADWDQSAHDDSCFVSCTHLRNLSHMTLGVLSLMLHTCCEKAMIPCNSGRLRLPLPSPSFEARSEATVEYDSRLHVDTHLHLMGGASDNMLCTDSRLALPSNWTLVNFARGGSALVYASVLDAYPQLQQALTTGRLFPFPPESVAHASCVFEDMYTAHRRMEEFAEKNPFYERAAAESLFAVAMLKMGASIRLDEFQHVQPSLTDCVTRDSREVPCVTLEHGCIFTLVFSKGQLLLQPVAPTHAYSRVSETATDGVRPFQRLPLETEAVCLSSGDFRKLFRHGLKVLAPGTEFRVAVDITYSDEKRLPFYLFPVVHFPVLVLVQHEGWTMRMPDTYREYSGDILFMDSSDKFYSEHVRLYHMRLLSCEAEQAWLRTHAPELLALSGGQRPSEPSELSELRELEAYFDAEDASEARGLWARYQGVRVHFNSVHHLHASMRKGLDVALYVRSEDTDDSGAYYILRHESWGLAPVCSAGSGDSTQLLARFPYYFDKSQDKQHLETLENKLLQITHGQDLACAKELEQEIAEWRAEMEAQPDIREALREIQFTRDFNDFVPNIMPVGEGREETDACWGLVVEHDGAFLAGGCYTVSVLCKHPNHTNTSHLLPMDFIAMSRCMLVEGSELWIKITKSVYKLVLSQAQQQGFKVMLPVSAALHDDMPEQHSCYLRCFYVLGGSLHASPVEANSVTAICTIASRRSIPGKKNAFDDRASEASRVNQNISTENMRFVAISLPILHEDSSPLLDFSRDPALPFYNYLKEQ